MFFDHLFELLTILTSCSLTTGHTTHCVIAGTGKTMMYNALRAQMSELCAPGHSGSDRVLMVDDYSTANETEVMRAIINNRETVMFANDFEIDQIPVSLYKKLSASPILHCNSVIRSRSTLFVMPPPRESYVHKYVHSNLSLAMRACDIDESVYSEYCACWTDAVIAINPLITYPSLLMKLTNDLLSFVSNAVITVPTSADEIGGYMTSLWLQSLEFVYGARVDRSAFLIALESIVTSHFHNHALSSDVIWCPISSENAVDHAPHAMKLDDCTNNMHKQCNSTMNIDNFKQIVPSLCLIVNAVQQGANTVALVGQSSVMRMYVFYLFFLIT